MFTDAIFSPDRLYRYMLLRWWGEGEVDYAKCAFFIGLNPSTADETLNDPTIVREMDFARQWGFPGMLKGNLFGFRATDPKIMKQQRDPVGPGNDAWLVSLHQGTSLTVCAWGNHGTFMARGLQVMGMLWNDLHCFKVTKANQPIHPLYLAKSSSTMLYRRGLGIQ